MPQYGQVAFILREVPVGDAIKALAQNAAIALGDKMKNGYYKINIYIRNDPMAGAETYQGRWDCDIKEQTE